MTGKKIIALWRNIREAGSIGTVYRNGDWLTRCSRNYEDSINNRRQREISSNKLKCSNQDYAHLTLRKIMFLKFLERNGGYSWQHMLVIVNPYNKSPLTALLLFSTPMPGKVRYRVAGTCRECDFTGESSFCKNHRVAVFGLYPGKKNRVQLELVDETGKVRKRRWIVIQTEPLPEELRDEVSVRKKSDLSAFPFLLVSGGHDITTCAFDAKGQIRFYLAKKGKAYGIYPMSGGRFIYTEKYVSIPSYFIPQGGKYYDMDYLGGVSKTYFTPNGIHHCAKEMEPGGNYIMGSSSFSGSSENAVVEIDRETGEIVKMLVMDSLFDDYYQNVKDWCHVNSLDYNGQEHSVIISLRNIHAIVKVDWETFELKWILSNPDFWEKTEMKGKLLQPEGDIKWFYQQHAAYVTEQMEEGVIRLVVYDNHWDRRRRAKCFDGDEKYSYVTVFDIYEEEKRVTMVRTVPLPKSTIRSNAILQERCNRLFHMSANLLKPIEGAKGLIEELNYETGEVINSYLVKPGFFSAYPFAPRADVLENWKKEEGEYMVGNTIPILELEENEVDLKQAKEYFGYEQFSFDEGVLYVKGADHEITALYFRGGNKVYGVNIVERIREKEKLAENVYSIPIQVCELDCGSYDIYFVSKQILYRIGDAFTVEEKV